MKFTISDELSLKKLIEDTKGGVKAAVDFVGAENILIMLLMGQKRRTNCCCWLFGGHFKNQYQCFL